MPSSNALEDNPISQTSRQLPLYTRIPSRRITPSPQQLTASEGSLSPGSSLPQSFSADTTFSTGSDDDSPPLLHRWHHNHSILSTAAFPTLGLLFCGTHDHQILVLDMVTFERRQTLTGHTGSVLCLTKSADEKYLFSGGSDSLVKVWDVTKMEQTHTIYSLVDIGDIFSIAWCDHNNTVYFGCQNASILFVKLDYITHKGNPDFLPSNRFDKFFDSKGPAGNVNLTPKRNQAVRHARLIEVPSANIFSFAHNGFVYSMDIYEKTHLVSGGGDGIVHIWDLAEGGLQLLKSLDNDDSVFSMAIYENFLYCGLPEGKLKLWDLKTFQQIMLLHAEDDKSDSLTIATTGYCVFKGSENGVTKWKFGTDSKATWATHKGLVLSTEIFEHGNTTYLVTGGSDSSVAIWNVTDLNHHKTTSSTHRRQSAVDLANESLLMDLSELVSFKTVSKKPENYIDDSRRCAHYLTNLFKKFGADSELLPVDNGNPIVYACFKGYKDTEDEELPRILWYGHYDVIEAGDSNAWDNNPFKMTASDGYLYGRGVSDNKGPVLAAIYAVTELLQKGELKSDIVFLIEGEEECGSFGFQNAISKFSNLIGNVDWILLSNSYWLDDATPCLNYGLRGVISATVEVSSDSPDRHSGVDGGAAREPTMDLVKLLSYLTGDDGKVAIPNFYDTLKPLSADEEKLYDAICSKADISIRKETLLAKWRSPSLTVHKIDVSGPGNNTVIPKSSKGFVSIRIVPDQTLECIKSTFIDYLTTKFAQLKSDNHLEVRIIHEAEPWLGDRGNAAYEILKNEIKKEWQTEPFYIREGGSIPSVRFLEKMLNAPAAQIPCGQSTDNAHLDNERLRVANLYALRNILKRSFLQLPKRRS